MEFGGKNCERWKILEIGLFALVRGPPKNYHFWKRQTAIKKGSDFHHSQLFPMWQDAWKTRHPTTAIPIIVRITNIIPTPLSLIALCKFLPPSSLGIDYTGYPNRKLDCQPRRHSIYKLLPKLLPKWQFFSIRCLIHL